MQIITSSAKPANMATPNPLAAWFFKSLNYIRQTSWPAWLLLGAITVYLLVALLTHTEWLFGDDYLFMIANNQGTHSPVILEAGRFYPFGFAEFNLLWFFPGARSIFAHDLVTATMLILVMFTTAKIYQSTNAAANRSPTYGWTALAMTTVMVMTPAFTQIFMNIVYPEKMVILFGSLFVLFYIRAFNSRRNQDYILAAIAAFITTYCKEPAFGVFVIIAITHLIFNFRSLTRADKWFTTALILNGIIFLSVYFALTATQQGTLYFEGKNAGSFWELGFKMLMRNKIIIVLIAAALWRFIMAIYRRQPPLHLVFDSLIYGAVSYYLAYVVLKLQDNYYLTPLYCLGLPGLYYYLRQPNYHRIFRAAGWVVILAISATSFPTPWFLVDITHSTRAEHGLLLRQLATASTDGRTVYWFLPSQGISYPLHSQQRITKTMTKYITNNKAKDFQNTNIVPRNITPGSMLVVTDFLNGEPQTQQTITEAINDGRIRLRYHIWNLRLFEFW